MGYDQYHEPPEEMSEEARTFARVITSMIEEAEAISWYQQRMSVEKDQVVNAILSDAQQEEFKHFGMELEYLLRGHPAWRTIMKAILFQEGDIVANGKKGEEAASQLGKK